MNPFDLSMDEKVHKHLEIDLGDTLFYVNVFEIDVPENHYHIIMGHYDKSGKIKYNKQEHFLSEHDFCQFANFLDDCRRQISIRRSHMAMEEIRQDYIDEQEKQMDFVEDDGDHVSLNTPNLFRDVIDSETIKNKMRASKSYCKKFYAAMCNTDLYKVGSEGEYGYSWRAAGGLVADILGEGDYLDWYCSGNEGFVDDEIADDLNAIGWVAIPMEVDTSEYNQGKLL